MGLIYGVDLKKILSPMKPVRGFYKSGERFFILMKTSVLGVGMKGMHDASRGFVYE
jgi:hypothetical protein